MNEKKFGPEALLPGILYVSLRSFSGEAIEREVYLDGTPTDYLTFQKIPVSKGTYRVSLAGNDYYPSHETATILSGATAAAEFRQR